MSSLTEGEMPISMIVLMTAVLTSLGALHPDFDLQTFVLDFDLLFAPIITLPHFDFKFVITVHIRSPQVAILLAPPI